MLRLQVVLADAVDQQDKPMHRLAFGRGEVGALRQTHGRRSKVGPAPIKIEQVAGRCLPALLSFWLIGVPTGSAHVGRLIQPAVRGRVKKA
jgi:hypothetical protein